MLLDSLSLLVGRIVNPLLTPEKQTTPVFLSMKMLKVLFSAMIRVEVTPELFISGISKLACTVPASMESIPAAIQDSLY